MKQQELHEKPLTRVKNVGGCTNFGGFDIVGNKMYTIKTRSDDQLSYISVYPDYRKTTRTNHKFAGCMGHGNDIAYHSGHLYVAPCDRYVEVVDIGNWSHTRLYCDHYISAIAHYSGNQFVALSDVLGATYFLMIIEPRGNKMEVIQRWEVNNPKASAGYTVPQSMGFKKSTSAIFVVFSKNDFHRNVILRSKVGSPNPTHCFRSKKDEGKYEFEGISFNSSGKYIIGANLPNGMDTTFIAG